MVPRVWSALCIAGGWRWASPSAPGSSSVAELPRSGAYADGRDSALVRTVADSFECFFSPSHGWRGSRLALLFPLSVVKISLRAADLAPAGYQAQCEAWTAFVLCWTTLHNEWLSLLAVHQHRERMIQKLLTVAGHLAQQDVYVTEDSRGWEV